MMKLNIEIEGINYQANLSNEHSIAITLIPNGQQPSHFGAPACTSKTLEGEGFIGDTRQGGSCNVNQLSIIPHCNGTHTESVSHIVDQLIPVYQAIENSLIPTVLISLETVKAIDTDEQYLPKLDRTNQLITRKQLTKKLKKYTNTQMTALAIRTLPNHDHKKSTVYCADNYPIYLTNDAMAYLVERQVKHLMVDFPSVDKMYDDGMLSNHRIFWNVATTSKQLNTLSNTNKTITEMIFVDNQIKDGFYLCNLQIPEINTDAVPSRPVLYPLSIQ